MIDVPLVAIIQTNETPPPGKTAGGRPHCGEHRAEGQICDSRQPAMVSSAYLFRSAPRLSMASLAVRMRLEKLSHQG